MKHVIVRYTVKAERAADNEAYVRAVFAQLDRERPAGLRYATYKLADGVSFVHVATIDTPGDTNPLQALAAFQRFAQRIEERCVEPPVATTVEQVGFYTSWESVGN